MLKYRLITSPILMFLAVVVIFFLPPILFILLALIICIQASWEWGPLAGINVRSQRILVSILFGILLTLMILSGTTQSCAIKLLITRTSLCLSLIWWLIALLLVLFYPQSAAFWQHSRSLRLLSGILTIVPFFWGMLVLRLNSYEENHLKGAWSLFYVMLVVWSLDSGAYIFGKILGTHKLAPKVSPDKTWEGLIGGLITSLLIAWTLVCCAPLNIMSDALPVCWVSSACAGVLGDLSESMFKRAAGIKDTGYLIPGHGGILDRIDSLTASVPVFAFLILLVF